MMLKVVFTYLIYFLPLYVFAQQSPAIIPLPQIFEWGNTYYVVPSENTIVHNSGAALSSSWLNKLLLPISKVVKHTTSPNKGNWNLVVDKKLISKTKKEGYILDINEDGITLQAASDTGIFYGIQTIRQMLPSAIEAKTATKQTQLQYVHIEDFPSFEWRGTMIDVARRFFNIHYLKEHIDRMALLKLNRLHLHLTDDQGWRIEIKSKPSLTHIGSKGACSNAIIDKNGQGSSGYLSQDEYIELQKYAYDRKITIIPEIDMPGHIYAALVSLPELNCDALSNIDKNEKTGLPVVIPPQLYEGQAVGWSKLCLSNPEAFAFACSVIDEIASITTGNWIHIGGDEIKDPLYRSFIHKVDSLVYTKNKTTIGWEEILNANIHSSTLAQVWINKVPNKNANPTIYSMCSSLYLDHANTPGQRNCATWCTSYISLEKVYNTNILTDNKLAIGLEAAVWTEKVEGDTAIDNRLWPRLLGVAEIAWSNPSIKNYQHFKSRVDYFGERLSYLGINFFKKDNEKVDYNEISIPYTNIFQNHIPVKP